MVREMKTVVREKTGVRIALGILSIVSLVVLTAAGSTPPNLAKALAAQQELVAERPYDAEIHNDHGNLLVLAGRDQEAGEAYRRAIELAPSSTLARYNLGILLRQSGQRKQAEAEFQGLLEIDARHARTYYQLGILFHSRNQRAKAVEHYARAFAYDPELTFPSSNPHIIDNDLATEAILVSRRYDDAADSDMPRLYGEPERIAGLMLATDEEASPSGGTAPEVQRAEPLTKAERKKRKKAKRALDLEENGETDSEESESKPDRRALTSEDLDTGSSTGRVEQKPRRPRRSSSGRATGRPNQGRDGRSAVRPRSPGGSGAKKDSGAGKDSGGPTVTGGTVNGGQTPFRTRYRPPPPPAGAAGSSRFSTGRLELKLLPAGSSAHRDAATATR